MIERVTNSRQPTCLQYVVKSTQKNTTKKYNYSGTPQGHPTRGVRKFSGAWDGVWTLNTLYATTQESRNEIIHRSK